MASQVKLSNVRAMIVMLSIGNQAAENMILDDIDQIGGVTESTAKYLQAEYGINSEWLMGVV